MVVVTEDETLRLQGLPGDRREEPGAPAHGKDLLSVDRLGSGFRRGERRRHPAGSRHRAPARGKPRRGAGHGGEDSGARGWIVAPPLPAKHVAVSTAKRSGLLAKALLREMHRDWRFFRSMLSKYRDGSRRDRFSDREALRGATLRHSSDHQRHPIGASQYRKKLYNFLNWNTRTVRSAGRGGLVGARECRLSRTSQDRIGFSFTALIAMNLRTCTSEGKEWSANSGWSQSRWRRTMVSR